MGPLPRVRLGREESRAAVAVRVREGGRGDEFQTLTRVYIWNPSKGSSGLLRTSIFSEGTL